MSAWHDGVGDATLGEAIPDRLIHNVHGNEDQGPFMRETVAKK